MKHLTLSIAVGLLVVGCSVDAPGASGDGPGDPRFIAGDGGAVCAHPREGCACEPSQPPIDCYLDPVETETGGLMCRRGTRTCRDGFWTGCESIHEYELRSGPGIGALVTGPTECNPCDPACAVSRDVPTSSDLPGSSEDVEYDPGAGGIHLEYEGTTIPTLPDSDGDGVPDVADECPGPGAYRAADGSCYGDTFLFHELPYGGPAEIDPLDIMVQVRTADVYFLMDTTGSMGGEIVNLQDDLTSGSFIPGCSGGIIGAIRCTIPDAWFGVGRYDDYPVSPYGGGSDVVYEHLQDIDASISAAQTAVNGMYASGGSDGPESQSQALWAVATGGGLGPYLSPQSGCAGSEWGYPCFREGTIPIVIHFTDERFHNGPYGYDYAGGGGGSLPSTTSVSGNDTIASARYIGDAATTWTGWTGNTCGAGADYADSCTGSSSDDVVFRFDVSVRRRVRMTTDGSSYDTLLSLRDSSGAEIACNDDGGPGLTSQIDRVLAPGTYYVVVKGWSTNCGTYRLSVGEPGVYPVTWAETVAALNETGIRVITIHSGYHGEDDADALADATGAYSSGGSRYVFDIASDGTGLSTAVIDAVVDLANYNRMDITARATDDAGTPIDERGFVDSISAVSWGPGSCSGISGGSTFVQCLPGTSVDFNVSFRNDFVMPTMVPQVFDFFIEVVGDGSFVLDRIPVRIVVPPEVPSYPPDGSYWRDYDSTAYCADNERPDWGDLSWDIVDLPAGTSVRWELRAAEDPADLDTATPITFTTPPTSSPVDVAAQLVSAGVGNYVPHLRVTAVLLADSSRTETPVLRSFELRFTCVPTE
ncbi:MAG TPA: PPC domain-containing protein [Sandaracinaceae bacterium LLY-WYZ-13_1]|nr:PPC domain-containing protein [Sandaracinaceae bacterium LLY-WYZ-13_1]